MRRRRRVGFDPIGTVLLTPEVVRAEIRKTYTYTDLLHGEFVEAFVADHALTPAKQKFFEEWAAWKNNFNGWADSNLNDPWMPDQVYGMKAINNQNNVYRKEAEGYQGRFRSLGYTSNVSAPTPAPGLGKGGGGGGFFAGMGTGALAVLVLGAFLLMKGKD